MQPGGQDSQLVAPDLSTHLDATYLLQTHDHPPAFISVKSEGWRVGPREILEKLEDPAVADEVDPKSYCFRLFVHMETGDTRYLHLNTGMWVGSGVRRGTEGMSCSMLFPPLLVALGGETELTWVLQLSTMPTASPRWISSSGVSLGMILRGESGCSGGVIWYLQWYQSRENSRVRLLSVSYGELERLALHLLRPWRSWRPLLR